MFYLNNFIFYYLNFEIQLVFIIKLRLFINILKFYFYSLSIKMIYFTFIFYLKFNFKHFSRNRGFFF